jgi:hypothetical protein
MNDISRLSYPDFGNPLEDASIIRNAVYFSTAERVYSAELVLKEPINVDQRTLDFMVVRAFEEFMTSTEDLLGWLFALQEWKPGEAERSLFILLVDKVKVGKGKYSEDNAVSLLKSVDAEGFRRLFHIPTDEELMSAGVSVKLVDDLRRSVPFKLDGWLRIAKERAEQARGKVRMFNKLKHHLIVFPMEERGKVWVPASVKMDIKQNQIGLDSGFLEANPNEVRRLASSAIVAQAVLHDTLAIILLTRYGEKYRAPNWVVRAYQTYL